ncbi:MAG TPA: T9SS type A sorting domain-containing protein [Flavobacteriales bacterium]|nr:T9SS type A sorting domain-containing protein [Flavobacteriales bacterium]
MKLFRSQLLAFALITAGGHALAQGPVDIGLFANGNDLEVRVRPGADFEDIFSAVVFTIRWDRSSGAMLGDLVQDGPALQYMPLDRSGGVREHGPYNYQVFAGFGMQRMQQAGATWEAGKEYVLMTIPVQGVAEFELVNDAWTGELMNNADFYASLGGRDMTGMIYKGLASVVSAGGVDVIPNPNNGRFTFTFNVIEVSDVRIELVNTLGQSVFTDLIRAFEGTYRREMDLTGMSNGIYYLKVTRGDETEVEKVVYR